MPASLPDLPRFFVERLPALPPGTPESSVLVEREEAHHLLHVLRMKPKDQVRLFDGSGQECVGVIQRVDRRTAEVAVRACQTVDLEPALDLTLATAVPRGQRMDFLVEKCGELGLRRLIPVHFEHSVIDPRRNAENHLRRWRRISISASKQSGRSRLTEIGAPSAFTGIIHDSQPSSWRMLLCPQEDSELLSRLLPELLNAGRVLAVVGPEGGLTADERAGAESAGFRPVTLGRTVLRVESAAIALTARLLGA